MAELCLRCSLSPYSSTLVNIFKSVPKSSASISNLGFSCQKHFLLCNQSLEMSASEEVKTLCTRSSDTVAVAKEIDLWRIGQEKRR